MRPFFRIYGDVIRHAGRLVPGMMRPAWLLPSGPRTVLLEGPVIKWCAGMAGLSRVLARPPHFIAQKQSHLLRLPPKYCSFMACHALLSVSQCMLLLRSLDSEWKKWQEEKAQREHPDFMENRAEWPFQIFVD
ncbi:mitochondrial pyruvate carrier 2 [Drosophila bipectinata]|uniref:mitochondrial pyruvate carrier 2 n=1 Tax=Drosophila bipectinata TaxID=42026 RepID=UPI0038B34768